MDSPVLILVLLIVLAVVAVVAVRASWRAWRRYRARIAMLKQAEQDPSILENPEGNGESAAQAAASSSGIDYTVVGVTLGIIGTFSILSGKIMHVGQIAVGTFLGGIICFCLGLLLSLFGLLIRGTKRG